MASTDVRPGNLPPLTPQLWALTFGLPAHLAQCTCRKVSSIWLTSRVSFERCSVQAPSGWCGASRRTPRSATRCRGSSANFRTAWRTCSSAADGTTWALGRRSDTNHTHASTHWCLDRLQHDSGRDQVALDPMVQSVSSLLFQCQVASDRLAVTQEQPVTILSRNVKLAVQVVVQHSSSVVLLQPQARRRGEAGRAGGEGHHEAAVRGAQAAARHGHRAPGYQAGA